MNYLSHYDLLEKTAFTKAMFKAPKAFIKGVSTKSPEMAFRGYRRQATDRGLDSLVLWPLTASGKKIFGKKKTEDFLWKTVSGPALIADTATGNFLRKIPGAKGIFTQKEKIPWGGRKDMYKEVSRASALAPLVKTKEFATPFIVGLGMERGLTELKKMKQRKQQQNQMPKMASDQDLREKAASAMLRLHEENKEHKKRAHALQLIYKQAEMGIMEFPRTFGELQEKVASLATQDLEVFEKALELTGGTEKLGEVGGNIDPQRRNASEMFQAAILGDETF